MRKNGREAVAYMKSLYDHGATGVKGLCLRTCRLAWGLPADQPSAIAEWESIPSRFKHRDFRDAPVGAPHFWRGGKYGHVALQATQEGHVWTTDLPTTNKVGLVDIMFISTKWRYTYLGWSEQFQDAVLPLGV